MRFLLDTNVLAEATRTRPEARVLEWLEAVDEDRLFISVVSIAEIRRGLQFLAATPGAGHSRDDLTDEPVKFWPAFSYLIVYDPGMTPLGVARVLHGGQDLETMFKNRPPRA